MTEAEVGHVQRQPQVIMQTSAKYISMLWLCHEPIHSIYFWFCSWKVFMWKLLAELCRWLDFRPWCVLSIFHLAGVSAFVRVHTLHEFQVTHLIPHFFQRGRWCSSPGDGPLCRECLRPGAHNPQLCPQPRPFWGSDLRAPQWPTAVTTPQAAALPVHPA